MIPSSITVARIENGRTLAAVVKARLRMSWTEARELIASRRVRVGGQTCGDVIRRLRTGERLTIVPPKTGKRLGGRKDKPVAAKPKPESAPAISIVYCDSDIVVVDKPPGLTTVRHADEAKEFGDRGQKFLPKTLADMLPGIRPDLGAVRAVHRLDRDTSGLVVFARTPAAERHLGKQFRAHSTARRYLAIVRGEGRDARIESWFVRDRGDGRRGSGPPGEGQRAVTHVQLRERLGTCSLVECRLETGRTHQVRIHLGEAGTPLAGETVYDRPLHGAPVTDSTGAPRIALHAEMLGLTHPTTGERMEWTSPIPQDMTAVLHRLRRKS